MTEGFDRLIQVVQQRTTPSDTQPSGDDSAVLYANGTALTPKFAAVAASSNGNNTIVSAVSGKKIRVISGFAIATTAVTATFQSGAGGTALTGAIAFAANGGIVLPYNPVGWFETAASTLLNLNLTGAVAVSGAVAYVED